MRFHGFLIMTLVLVAPSAVAQTPVASPGHPGWTKTASGCFVWNGEPKSNETALWAGRCENGRVSGKGTMIWRYEGNRTQRVDGEFRDDKQTGRGIRNYPSGNRYDGEWQDNKANGAGRYVWTDGQVFNGFWHDGCYRDGTRRVAVGVDLSSCP